MFSWPAQARLGLPWPRGSDPHSEPNSEQGARGVARGHGRFARLNVAGPIDQVVLLCSSCVNARLAATACPPNKFLFLCLFVSGREQTDRSPVARVALNLAPASLSSGLACSNVIGPCGAGRNAVPQGQCECATGCSCALACREVLPESSIEDSLVCLG